MALSDESSPKHSSRWAFTMLGVASASSIFFGATLFSSIARSGTHSKSETSARPEMRRKTDTGVYFDEPITIKIGADRFKVPAGYFEQWPRAENLHLWNPENKNIRLNFIFWMPSRRPLEIRTAPPMIRPQPTEPGRNAPSPEEFIVQVNFAQIVSRSTRDYVSPEKGFKNLLNAWGGSTIVTIKYLGLSVSASQSN